MKRKWTNVNQERILELRAAGKTRQEIADELGLEKQQIKMWITRYNRKQAQINIGIMPRHRGRPSQKQADNKDAEIQRLRMENELLRDFLRAVGRK